MNRREKADSKKRKRASRPLTASKAKPTSRKDDPRELAAKAKEIGFRGERRAVEEILSEGKTSEKFDEVIGNAIQFGDLLNEAASEKRAEIGTVLACKSGCSHCCHTQVAVTPIEAIALADAIRGNLSTARAEEIMAASRLVESKTAGLEWQERAPVPCPVLSVEGSCDAYAARPFACRGWTATSADPCRRFVEEWPAGESGANVDMLQFGFHQGIRDALAEGAEASGLDGTFCDLAGALRIALENPDARVRWLKGERMFGAARLNQSNVDPTDVGRRRLPVV